MTHVIVVGNLMTDVVARAELALARGSDTPSHVSSYGGGSGANIAAWLAVDGGDVTLISRRGSDITGRTRDMELMGYGVDARVVMDPERPTGSCVVMVTHKGDRTMLSDPAANAALAPGDIPQDLFGQGSHLHVSGYTLVNDGSRAACHHALRLARHTGMTISVDAASSAPLKRVGAEAFFEWTQGTRLLFANVAEAEVLTGRDDPAQAAKVLTAWFPEVVVKMAEEGAMWYANGQAKPTVVPAMRVERNVDGTGAGDAFCAGFLRSWTSGKSPAEALAAGCQLGARAFAQVGARPDLGAS